ncbi:MAG: fimbrillin family protein [Mucinivorans sp.]
MKKIIFLALAVVAIVSCKKNVGSTIEEPQQDVIALSTGNISLSKVANEGVRVVFGVDDQIGVFAAYADNQTTPTAPSWATGNAADQTGVYFGNIAAKCTTAGVGSAPAGTPAVFSWGADGTGGLTNNQIYPKNEKKIYLYSYYPYAASGTSIDPTAGPKLDIKLTDGAEDASIKQADVLWSVGASKQATPQAWISRTGDNQLAKLTFNHALAQLQFKIYRQDATVASCKFVQLEFQSPKAGSMNIMTGAIEVTPMDFTNATPTGNTVAKYTIGDPTSVVNITATQKTDATEINADPLMVFPMTIAQAQTCKLKIWIYFGSKNAVDMTADKADIKEYEVKLNTASTLALLQGKLNFISLGVGETTIELTADIEAWDPTGSSTELPIE